MPQPVTVIVPTIGRVDVLRHTLRSLVRQTIGVETIVVDQNPPGVSSLGSVEEEFRAVCTWIRTNVRNLPAARNLGALRANGSILVYCDDDIEAPPRYIENILLRYQDDRWGAVCGPSIGSDASWNDSPPCTDIDGDEAFWRGNFQSRISMEVRSGMGCNHSVRKRWWERVGGYDTNFTGGALREEGEFFVRLVRSGCRVYYDRRCWLYHPRGDRTGGCSGMLSGKGVRDRFQQRLRNHAYFLYKSFPGRARQYMLKELFLLFIRRQGLRSLLREPRLPLDWYRINREVAKITSGVPLS